MKKKWKQLELERNSLGHIYSIKCLAREGAGDDTVCAGALKYTWYIGSVKKSGWSKLLVA